MSDSVAQGLEATDVIIVIKRVRSMNTEGDDELQASFAALEFLLTTVQWRNSSLFGDTGFQFTHTDLIQMGVPALE